MSIVDTPEEARALELAPLLVRRPLEAFLDAHGLGSGPLEAEPVGEGHSNVTFLIRREGGSWVLRRPPRPPLPPSAHDVLREAFLLQALREQPVRIPVVVATCDDPAVIGAPFYVMQRVEGEVLTSAMPPALDDAAGRRAVAEELVDALAEVHAVDWRACGLEGYGKPTGYLERQLRRFSGLWEHNRTRELPALDRVTAWLAEHRPESPPATIVHGDYRLGNTMFAPGAPARLAAIFDWELATIGDPLADVGYLVATWSEPGDPEDVPFSFGDVTRRPGFPTRAELIARYEAATGRSMSDVRWYTTLALWKAAVFLEGSYRRRLAGTTDDPFFDTLERGVPASAERAWAVATAS
jgi:aminoglycoside phosphotransferase (APT) family kinase protein